MDVHVTEVTLLAFPRHDDTFHDVLHALARDIDGAGPEELQTRLRERYPNAVVRAQNALGSLSTSIAWYVYRDGTPRGD
jgi:hypothetical protein